MMRILDPLANPMNALFSSRIIAALFVAFALVTAAGVYLVATSLENKSERAPQSTVSVQVETTRVNIDVKTAIPGLVVFVLGAAGLLLLAIRVPMKQVRGYRQPPHLPPGAVGLAVQIGQVPQPILAERAERVPLLLGWAAQAKGSAVRVAAGDGQESLIVSYLTLRRIVGILGIALPAVVAMWGFALGYALQPSISDYHALPTRDAFVGILFTIGWFLFVYRGFDRTDEVTGNLACLFALGVALFPNNGTQLESTVHFSSAVALFLALACFSLFLFTKTGSAPPTPQKLTRNRVYVACGVIMLACIALIGLYSALGLKHTAVAAINPVFWLETLALWAFGFSWFVKGETLWQDAVS